MARGLNRGEIWMYTFKQPDKRRPVLVISRQRSLDVMSTAIVVPITTTMRGTPMEVSLGIEDGLKIASSANVANIESVPQTRLFKFVGVARPEKMIEVCRALAIASGCD